ncbi:hypothetical protein FISHEDRAFT_55211 [Fistulina hepatica ATCC 64428]|uniref:Uncharacterized protein n=1 Tax=Fistulina hepatica ATCC 64428 TaxID=1128425 RepID=A0A0D7AP52_9AGAR|nr:hypothetical protein FISHEDRAFT_55211 [Fistulina hepatica ATCC 64428]
MQKRMASTSDLKHRTQSRSLELHVPDVVVAREWQFNSISYVDKKHPLIHNSDVNTPRAAAVLEEFMTVWRSMPPVVPDDPHQNLGTTAVWATRVHGRSVVELKVGVAMAAVLEGTPNSANGTDRPCDMWEPRDNAKMGVVRPCSTHFSAGRTPDRLRCIFSLEPADSRFAESGGRAGRRCSLKTVLESMIAGSRTHMANDTVHRAGEEPARYSVVKRTFCATFLSFYGARVGGSQLKEVQEGE